MGAGKNDTNNPSNEMQQETTPEENPEVKAHKSAANNPETSAIDNNDSSKHNKSENNSKTDGETTTVDGNISTDSPAPAQSNQATIPEKE